jgi:hypothetical protein
MSIENLMRVLTPPAAPVENRGDWTAVEAALGTPLPSDYKLFIETYGSGRIDDGFLRIFNPFSRVAQHNLMKSAQEELEFLTTLFGSGRSAYPPFPKRNGLLPCGDTENADHLNWLTNGPPDDWTIVVRGRGRDWVQYAMSLTDTLAAILSRNVVCPAFPDDFPDDTPRFEVRSEKLGRWETLI